MSISSDVDTNSTQESDSAYDSEHDSDVDMGMQDDVDAPLWRKSRIRRSHTVASVGSCKTGRFIWRTVGRE